ALMRAAVSLRAFAPRIVHENPAHRFSRRGEEMGSVIPFPLIVAGEPQPRFVNEGGRLKCVARRFRRHFRRSEPAQFLVNERQQFIRRTCIALPGSIQDLREIVHLPSMTSDLPSINALASRSSASQIITSIQFGPKSELSSFGRVFFATPCALISAVRASSS